MPAAPADSALYARLFGDAETALLFTDTAEIRALLLVEGALARVQGALGLIPRDAAAFIDRASREVVLDPAAMAAETARSGVPVPALLAAFRKEAKAPELMAWLHWGATSQDIIDTALALRLRRVLDLWDTRLSALIGALGALAGAHADLAMAGRTFGQTAAPTSFGAVVAAWGRPLIAHRARLTAVQGDVCRVSLSGAAGTLSVLGAAGPQVRADLALALDLTDPGHSWHAERDGLIAFAGWMAGLAASLGKLAEDLILMSQSGIGEIAIAGAGGSSTMPQKQNPVAPSVLAALSRQIIALAPLMAGAGLHHQQRDGAAWFTEWLTLPQMCLSMGKALALAGDLAARLTPDSGAMARGLGAASGTIHAEALTFALAATLPRPEAERVLKALCAEALQSGTDLRALFRRDWPGVISQAQDASPLGQAPAEARAFARLALSEGQ